MSRRKLGSVQPDWLADRTYDPAGVGVDCPANPRHGQLHFPDQPNGGEDSEWFYYDEHKDKWLSMSRYKWKGLFVGNVAATNPIWLDYVGAGTVKFGAGLGYEAPYDLELMSMTCRTAIASTCTFQLYVNNAAHAGSTIALAAAANNQQDAYTSATINKGDYLGFYVTAGTAALGGVVEATFARVVV